MSEIDVNAVLQQMRSMAALAEGRAAAPAEQDAAQRPDFAGLLGDSIGKVNEMQQNAGQLATAFEVGEPGVDVARVMVAMEKASLYFQAMNQVRNKLVSAYQEVMSMQV